MNEAEFVEKIAMRLRKAGVSVETRAALGGIPVDLLIKLPSGQRVVVEIKGWETINRQNLVRALDQKRLLEQATRADRVFVVIAGLKQDRASEGILTEDGFFDTLTRELSFKAGKDSEPMLSEEKIFEDAPGKEQQKFVFAAMPYSPDFEDVYYLAMGPAARSVNAVCRRVDQESFVGDIMQEVKRLIKGSIAVIADVSGSNPNVLFEEGFAHALDRKTIQICRTPQEKLPFDVRNLRTLRYRQGQVHRLKEDLTKQLGDLLGKN